MRFLLGDGDRREIKCVPRVGLEGPDTPFAEQDVGVAMRQDVLGGKQPFLDAFAHSALQQDRFAASGRFDEKLKVLPVPRADLKDVRDFRDVLDIPFTEHFRDDLETCFLAGKGQQPRGLPCRVLEIRTGRCAVCKRLRADGSARRP